jgi:hypothetical protein
MPGELSGKSLDEMHPLSPCFHGDMIADAAFFLLSQ